MLWLFFFPDVVLWHATLTYMDLWRYIQSLCLYMDIYLCMFYYIKFLTIPTYHHLQKESGSDWYLCVSVTKRILWPIASTLHTVRIFLWHIQISFLVPTPILRICFSSAGYYLIRTVCIFAHISENIEEQRCIFCLWLNLIMKEYSKLSMI